MIDETLAPISAGAAFAQSGDDRRRFVKDVLPVGKRFQGTNPAGKRWELNVTPEIASQIVASFYALRFAGHKVPAPENHHGRNHGFWSKLYIGRNEGSSAEPRWLPDRNGTHLVGELDVTVDASDVGTGLQEASIALDPDYTDSQGRTFPYAPLHIAPCTRPVVPGQANYVKIAASENGPERHVVLLSESEEQHMDPKKLRELFGLGDDVPDDKLPDAIVKAKAESDARHAEQVAEFDKLKTELQELKGRMAKGDAEAEAEGDQDKAKAEVEASEQAKVLASLTASNERLYRENVVNRANALVRQGRATPAMLAKLKLDTRTLTLSEHGQDDFVESLLEAMGANEAKTFPVAGGVTLSQHTGKPEGEGPDQEELGKEQGDLVAQMSGKLAASL